MRFLKQKGIGLISAVVAAGLVAGLGLYIAKLSQTSAKVTRTATNKLDLNATFNIVSNALLKEGVCTATLGGQAVGFEPMAVVQGSGLIPVGEKVPGTRYTTESLRFNYEAGTDQYYIDATFELDDIDQSYALKRVVKRFPVSVTMDTGVVAECHSDVSNAIDTAVTNAVETVEGEVPQCVYQEEACSTGYYTVQVGQPLEIPEIIKLATCTNHYKRHCWIGGAKRFTRVCEASGWGNKCSTGSSTCYSITRVDCENKVAYPGGSRILNKCCRPGTPAALGESTGNNNNSGSQTTTGEAEQVARWRCSQPSNPAVTEGDWVRVGSCTPDQAASVFECSSGVDFYGTTKCCAQEPGGNCVEASTLPADLEDTQSTERDTCPSGTKTCQNACIPNSFECGIGAPII